VSWDFVREKWRAAAVGRQCFPRRRPRRPPPPHGAWTSQRRFCAGVAMDMAATGTQPPKVPGCSSVVSCNCQLTRCLPQAQSTVRGDGKSLVG